jgi:hypothetical protein
MKKTAILTTLLLVSTGIAFAQSDETDNREKFQFELKAGLNYSNIYDETGEEFKADAKFGLAAGTDFKIPIGKYIGLQPEAMISQKGFKASGMMFGTPYTFTRTTTYIDLPLLITFKPSEFFTLLAGPQYSYLLDQHDVFISSASSYEQEKEFRQDNIRKNIFGVAAGLDINLKHITLGGRIGCDVQNNNGDGTSTTPRYKNVWVQGTIGYSFYKN